MKLLLVCFLLVSCTNYYSRADIEKSIKCCEKISGGWSYFESSNVFGILDGGYKIGCANGEKMDGWKADNNKICKEEK